MFGMPRATSTSICTPALRSTHSGMRIPRSFHAVHQQLLTLGHVSNFFASEPQIRSGRRLLTLAIGNQSGRNTPGRVFFGNSGTEACEAALKLTRLTGRSHVIAAEGSFHGRSMGALSLTSKAAYREPFEPLPGGVTFVPYGDVDALSAAVTDTTAAVVLEPIQGEAGVILPPRRYLRAAREITSQHGALLWLDEIQTGMGRTGTWWLIRTRRFVSRSNDPTSSRWRKVWAAESRLAPAWR